MNQVAPQSPLQAGVLAIGDELLVGAHPDLNSPYIAARLVEHGREMVEARSVGDDEEAIADAVHSLASRSSLVFVTGGLGPTEDDVTRHALARAAGVELEQDAGAWQTILDWYRRSGRGDQEISESNKRQALLPNGATLIPNCAGTAPGFRIQVGGATVIVLPGPPREVAAVWADQIGPWLESQPGVPGARAVETLVFSDLSESVFADGAQGWLERGANPLIGVTVKGGVLTCRIVARAADGHAAQSLAAERAGVLAARFPTKLVSRAGRGPAAELVHELLARGLSVTTAESCTGGLVVGSLTAVPGVSAVLREGWVTYANQAKIQRLGVPAALLEAHGAVSEEVAGAMARGAAEAAGARLGIAVSGIAGPDGGTAEKPVGLVCYGLCLDGAVRTVSRRFPDAGRERIRTWATAKALVEALATVRA